MADTYEWEFKEPSHLVDVEDLQRDKQCFSYSRKAVPV